VNKSDDNLGKSSYRDAINPILYRYKKVELSENGEILQSIEEGFEPLFNAPIPTSDDSIKTKINSAIYKFRRVASTIDDRRDALRDLADGLEFLRDQIKTVFIKKDEADLFNIANSFGIRHHNVKQKTDYDTGIWHSWIFYCYLSTIHACLRLIERQNRKEA